jgi:hypothetical protein
VTSWCSGRRPYFRAIPNVRVNCYTPMQQRGGGAVKNLNQSARRKP